MKQTPIHENFNVDLLAIIPRDLKRIVEIGCSSGALAREYRKSNPSCHYIGLEIDPDYADAARRYCSEVLVGDIEQMSEAEFASLAGADCWIFGDVLEHIKDTWGLLHRVRRSLRDGATIAACIPNAQHWTVQFRLNSGEFRYQDSGLLDRTHLRWFTKMTIGDLFRTTGFSIVDVGGRILVNEPHREMMLEGIQAFAAKTRVDTEAATSDATIFQWVVRATADAGANVQPANDRFANVEQAALLRDHFNANVLAMIPESASRIVDVGCGTGALADEYQKAKGVCEYIGVEARPRLAEMARHHCTRMVDCDIEDMGDDVFQSLFPASCVILHDALERFYDPWSFLRRLRAHLSLDTSVVASIANAQHWKLQSKLNRGDLRYDYDGFPNPAHIRWFTKTTMRELFTSTGFEIVEGGGLVVDEAPEQEAALEGIRALADAAGIDGDEAVANAVPVRWLVRAVRS